MYLKKTLWAFILQVKVAVSFLKFIIKPRAFFFTKILICSNVNSNYSRELESSKHQKLELRELLVSSQKEANKLKSDLKKLTEEVSVLNRVNQLVNM